jgi:hypothetical protein
MRRARKIVVKNGPTMQITESPIQKIRAASEAPPVRRRLRSG